MSAANALSAYQRVYVPHLRAKFGLLALGFSPNKQLTGLVGYVKCFFFLSGSVNISVKSRESGDSQGMLVKAISFAHCLLEIKAMSTSAVEPRTPQQMWTWGGCLIPQVRSFDLL